MPRAVCRRAIWAACAAAYWAACAAGVRAALAAPPAMTPPAPAVKEPVLPPAAPTVEAVYTGDKFRDPFLRAASANSSGPKAASAAASEPMEFSIHVLSLRAVLKDQGSGFAIIADMGAGISYIFRSGKLYDPKGKALPGIGGTMNIQAKTVTLKAADGDVQVLRLGEEEKGSNP